ncbi:alpha-(1,3)-fucosyltransferase B [Onthophagus taurus]|uniref:alpha-(1,3)-fucosyltransferase B n=1 Tax=Onthophagus taurus TaxID=166361 RepID=UPI0039BE0C72
MRTRLKLVICVILGYFLIQFLSRSYYTEEYPVILWWTNEIIQDETITCDIYKCLISGNRDYFNKPNLAVIAFYGSSIDLIDLPLPRENKTWALYHEESSRNTPWLIFPESQNLFNVTSTFSRYSNYPLTLSGLNDDSITGLKYYLPLPLKKRKKLSPIVYIQSICDNPIQRDSYVKKLMDYMPIDSFGKCLNNKELPEELQLNNEGVYDLYQEDLMNFIAQYKFSIAIENCICNDYITEKLWRPLIAGSVPIYFGSPTIKDWLPNNKSAIILDDFKTIKELADYINQVNKNDTMYLEYLQHKLADHNLKMTNEFLQREINNRKDTSIEGYNCYLCKSFHEKTIYNPPKQSPYKCSKHKAWESFWKRGKCEAKILDMFVNRLQLKNFTKQEFEGNITQAMNLNQC